MIVGVNDIKLGTTQVREVMIMNKIIWRKFKSPRAKIFVEFNRDNGYNIPLTIESIDTYCEKSTGVIDKWDSGLLLFGNSGFGTVNLVDPTKFRASAYGGLTWSFDGCEGDGANGYISTNVNLGSTQNKYKQYNASRGVVLSGTIGSTIALDGCQSNQFSNRLHQSNNNPNRINSTTNMTLDTGNDRFIVINKTDNVKANIIINSGLYEYDVVSQSIGTYGIQNIYRAEISVTTYSNNKLQMYFLGENTTLTDYNLVKLNFNVLLTKNGITPIA